MRKAGLAVLCLLILPAPARADDFQSWNQLQIKALDTKYVDYVNYWELRLGERASNLSYWQTTQKLQFDFFKYLGLGTNYTYLESKSANAAKTGGEFKYQHRLELEANPRWTWQGRLTVRNRNRVEFRWIEGRGAGNTRLRHLLEAEIPVRGIPAVKSVFANEEIFIDCTNAAINENRAVPFGLTFRVYRETALRVYYMVQAVKGPVWKANHILGTQLSIDF